MREPLPKDDLLDPAICSESDSDDLLDLNVEEYLDILDHYTAINTEKFFE